MKVDLEISPLSAWLRPPAPARDGPLIVAGPCSAESEEQVLLSATQIAKLGKVSIFRAGIWKPRTRPGSFDGVGAQGLRWLEFVKQQTGLPCVVEVATVQHVEECLKAGIDMLWIGARTTVNPFWVQKIADALRGADIPVFVKNPINPELQLWIGALERLNRAGMKKLVAVHRGFSMVDAAPYRNAPCWAIPIELKCLIPELPLICDPSHICGRRDLLQRVSQKALDLSMDGLMIESHPTPESALSDGEQQITPLQLGDLLSRLVVPGALPRDSTGLDSLEYLRKKIDRIDQEIIELLASRMTVVAEIAQCKKTYNLSALQVARWNQIIADRLNHGSKKGLEDSFVREIFTAIHHEAIRRQTESELSKQDIA